MDQESQLNRLRASGLLFGIGLGGFFDGIVLHQILQWHHMVSHVDRYPMTTLEGLQANTLADGFFHVFAYVVTIAGLVVLWLVLDQRGRIWSRKGFIGLLLMGWGTFNIVEGLINHHLLRIHVVREEATNPDLWNWGFLILSILILAGGYALYRGGDWRASGDERGTGAAQRA
jgi:uncharacterized membrane protein